MNTIPNVRAFDKYPTRFYAYLGDTYGTAARTSGGFLFRADGARTCRLVLAGDPQLMLLGQVDLAEAQAMADDLAGGFAAIACNRGGAR